MEIYEVYNELKQGSALNINRFIAFYNKVDLAHSLSAQQNHQYMNPPPQNNNSNDNNHEV